MKFGVVFPQTEFGSDPAAIKAYAQTAESLGYDYLLAYDHVLGANPERPGGWRGPYTFRETFHEPFTLFSYMAALTTRLEFVTGIIILPQRQTALVAKQAAQVDVFSGGRLRLGVGIGWNAVEYEGLNEDFHNRGKRVEEQVTLLRQLWTQPLVNFKGDYHSIPDAGINPLPVQRPIPIWFGGSAEAAMQRIARLGDGWMPNTAPIEKLAPEIEKMRAYVAEAERDPAAFGLDIRLNFKTTEEPAEAVAAWTALGATHISINTMGMGFTSPDQHIAAVQNFKSAL